MKKLYVAIFVVLVSSLTSCVDLEEEYVFHADGSCNVIYNFDMSTAVSVLANLLPDSVKQSPQYGEAKDTTVNFYTALPDTTQQKMDSIQVGMAKNSDLVLMMNLKRNLMKASIRYSADNSHDLDYYLKHLSKMTSQQHLSTMMPESKSLKKADGSQFVLGQDYYNYDIGPHKFYRTIDKAKFSQYIKTNESVFNLSKAMLIDMPYRITLTFPDPVTRVDNAKAVLSADKKTVTLQTNIEDAFKNPDIMNFKIDY
ncbi:hypothetical protein ACFGVR_20840 [Mucilaginibacter sp. AW1-3]